MTSTQNVGDANRAMSEVGELMRLFVEAATNGDQKACERLRLEIWASIDRYLTAVAALNGMTMKAGR